jgi:hypothetical protein
MSSNIHLYTAQTPNGIKISITASQLQPDAGWHKTNAQMS